MAEPHDDPAPDQIPALAPLDEARRRRPSFVEGEPVVLCNRQAWAFPMPKVFNRPEVNADGESVLVPRWTFGDGAAGADAAFDRLMFAVLESRGLDDDEYYRRIVVPSAEFLLARNYDLTEDQRLELLLPGPEDGPAAIAALVEGVARAAIKLPWEAMTRARAASPYGERGQHYDALDPMTN